MSLTSLNPKYLISFVLLLAISTQLDFDDLWSEVSRINLNLAGLSLILVICQINFLNMRWYSLLKQSNNSITYEKSSFINIAGYFANTFFLSSVSGVITKAGLTSRAGVSMRQAVFLSVLDKCMTFLSLIILGIIAFPFLKTLFSETFVIAMNLAISGSMLAVVLCVLFIKSGCFKGNIVFPSAISHAGVSLKNYMANSRVMSLVFFYSVIAQVCFFLGILALAMSFGAYQSVSPIQFLSLLPVIALASSLPISIGGWGVREGTFVYGLGLIGFPIESAFVLSVQVGIITSIAPFLVGLPYFFKTDLMSFINKSQ